MRLGLPCAPLSLGYAAPRLSGRQRGPRASGPWRRGRPPNRTNALLDRSGYLNQVIDRDRRNLPAQFRPMLAVAGELPTDDSAWAYEMKWDGLRAIATIRAGRVTLASRTGRDVTGSYPELAGMAGALGSRDVVLDGEIVAFGDGSWPSFEAIQQRMNVTSPGQIRRLAAEVPVTYLAFDLLFADGQSVTD